MSNRRFHVRFGYALVEMLVMISVVTMVMTVALSWIHASMRFSSAVKDRSMVHQQLNRLEEDLRTRIGRAKSIKVEGDTLILSSGESQTRYTIKDHVLERVHESNAADDAAQTGAENFRIGRDVGARWGTEELPEWVSLTIRQKPVSDDSASSIGSLETPKLEWYLRAGPRKAVQ